MADNLPVGYETSALAVQETDISDELGQSGAALGTLIQKTGLSVADTQNRLNTSSADSASALAQTVVDVIAVEEKVYDDSGNLDSINTHTRKLPLINFIDPAFYQWSKVRVQGQYYAREFASAQSSGTYSIKQKSGSGHSGFLVLLGGGYNTGTTKATGTERNRSSTADTAVGRMRMNVLLEPRDDVTVPKPRQVVQGPRISMIHGEIADEKTDSVITGRTMSVLIQYNKRDGTPIEGKSISIETNGVPWSYAGDEQTNDQGQLEIVLRRDFPDPETDTSPKDFILSARIGLVQNSITVTF